jgi:hypothetical protein
MKIPVPKAPWSAAARRRLALNNPDGGNQGDGSTRLALTPQKEGKGGVEPPQSKALRAFSSSVVRRRRP